MSRLIKIAKRRKVKKATPQEVENLIWQIVNSADSFKWGRQRLNKREAMTVLIWLTIEARRSRIEFSPHVIFKGQAGAGKTLLAKLLWPSSITSTLPMDEQGVGQMEMGTGHVVLKVDDAGEALWDNNKIMSTLYSMFHNEWSAKTHGWKQKNSETMAIITTNEENPIEKIAMTYDMQRAIRRHMVIGK